MRPIKHREAIPEERNDEERKEVNLNKHSDHDQTHSSLVRWTPRTEPAEVSREAESKNFSLTRMERSVTYDPGGDMDSESEWAEDTSDACLKQCMRCVKEFLPEMWRALKNTYKKMARSTDREARGRALSQINEKPRRYPGCTQTPKSSKKLGHRWSRYRSGSVVVVSEHHGLEVERQTQKSLRGGSIPRKFRFFSKINQVDASGPKSAGKPKMSKKHVMRQSARARHEKVGERWVSPQSYIRVGGSN